MKFIFDKLGSITFGRNFQTWSKQKLQEEVKKRTILLSNMGIKRGDIVLIIHGGTAFFFADLFAVWNLGACATCLNPKITNSELNRIINFLHPKLVLLSSKNKNALDVKTEVVDLNNSNLNFKNESTIYDSGNLDNKALILFTSGTTGTPKGVTHTFRSILSRIALNQQIISKEDMKRSLCLLPTHFGHGLIGNSLTPLLSGQNLILLNANTEIKIIANLGKVIDQHRITFMSSVPAMWRIVTKISKSPSKNTLKRIHIGSAPLSENLWKDIIKWSKINEVVNMYGITETANWIAGASATSMKPEDGLIGYMWGGMAAIKKKSGEIVSEGEGEIIVMNPSLMSGYHNLPKLNEEVFENGWFHTGDIGRIDDKGVMRLTGRIKSEINRAGFKIHPEDIDILLERHPSVIEACAFAIPDQISGEIVGVAVQLVKPESIDTEKLRKWCSKFLSIEKVPEKWFIISEIPKTDRGKINRDNIASVCLRMNKK
jgi:acyl-CoA synthetase (AMP-forming)/AMP-acid ligase II